MKGRFPELDGIRGIAILLVILLHYVYWPLSWASECSEWHCSAIELLRSPLRLGWSGVDLFFVLSGFLIGGILIDAKGGNRFFQTFYIRRFFRIVPLYAAFCLSYFLLNISIPETTAEMLDPPMPWWSYATFTVNFFLQPEQYQYFGAALWSLGIEEQFYLTLPLVIYLISRSQLFTLAAALIVLIPMARAAFALTSEQPFYTYMMPYFRGDSLLLGVVGAMMMREPRVHERLRSTPWILNTAALIGGAFFLLLIYWRWHLPTSEFGIRHIPGYSAIAFFYLALLLIGITRPESMWARFLRLGALRRMGLIAYGAYLLHAPIHQVVFFLARGTREASLQSVADVALTATSFLITVAVCTMSWTYFEAPLVAIGHRFSYREHAGERKAPAKSVSVQQSANAKRAGA